MAVTVTSGDDWSAVQRTLESTMTEDKITTTVSVATRQSRTVDKEEDIVFGSLTEDV